MKPMIITLQSLNRKKLIKSNLTNVYCHSNFCYIVNWDYISHV